MVESTSENRGALVIQDGDVKMADATTAKTEKAPKTPATPSALTSGSKTLFVGYLSYSVKRADVEEFFKGAGEVVDVQFASNEEGVFEGFGHVEFATGASAHKVSGCQLNCYSNCFGFHGHPQQPCCFSHITYVKGHVC